MIKDAAEIGGFNFRLKVTDLRKSFISPAGDRLEVLRGVSLSITAGDIVAVTGVSGSGKSTLLHLLAGIEAADHGSIVAGTLDIASASVGTLTEFRNRRVGLVFQFHHLLKDLSALENVSLPLRIQRQSKTQAMTAARSSLEVAGLGDRISHLVTDLSGGEQQRVAVCRALVTKPALVLADEPTGNLDAAMGQGIIETLVSYAHQTPAVVVLATHNERFAELCDRRFVLREGKLTEVIDQPEIRHRFRL